MDWNEMRQQWQTQVPSGSFAPVGELQRLDRRLQRRVLWRDRVETVAAIFVAAWFALVTLGSLAQGQWIAAAFAALIMAWAVFVPFRLHHARRQVPVAGLRMPLLDNLRQQRDAALVQARMLEQAWLWYLTPPAIGIAGLVPAQRGVTAGTVAYLAAVALLYAGVAWLNRHTARVQFRSHADELQRQIESLADGA